MADGATAAAFIARWQGIAALSDGVTLGVLSSEVHRGWSLASGERMGVGNDLVYNKTRCFEPFPLPDLHDADKFGGPIGVVLLNPDGTTAETETYGEYTSGRIRNLAEQLDAHRKRQQAAHPGLTLTGMYNVLEALRSGQPLTAKERAIHEQGLVSVLRQLHDELDEAVLYAYGWGDLLPLLRVVHGTAAPDEGVSREDAKRSFDEVIPERLVAFNAERAAEEARGLIRWLRPDFQNPDAVRERESGHVSFDSDRDAGEASETDPELAAAPATKPQPWPKDAVDQVRAVAEVIAASPCRSRLMRLPPGSLRAALGRSGCPGCWRCWWRWEGRRSRMVAMSRDEERT
ncbi:hypothetical protein H5368_01515 [Luteimonas sp. MC1782]|uniref:hypothetical protein n=1 Tax=Luteimonas sp. MC1782 TaxID=2760305 RepID=UPI0015FFAB27|nr:hypothetical protein [Luteimonas sp. MC1782]MBB1471704.1 hypothetical protein [Luteimonas sp. MC1782]